MMPPHQTRNIPSKDVKAAIKASGAVLAIWNNDWDTVPGHWWWICCDDPNYDLPNFPKNPRRDIRKGLEACEVKQVDGKWFCENGYDVYEAGFLGYGEKPPMNRDQFAAEFRHNAEYAGRETWGAFVDGRLVAYESCIIVDDMVLESSAKSDSNYHKSHPNNALVYTLTRHYLRERGMKYVTSGRRVLHHDTNVQEFQEKLGYRKVYCPLKAEMSCLASLATTVRIPFALRLLGIAGVRPNMARAFEGLSSVRKWAQLDSKLVHPYADSEKAEGSS